MKEIRLNFSEKDYAMLKEEADRMGVSLKQLLHDRSLGIDTENEPLNLAKSLSSQLGGIRSDINRIIQREARSDFGLFDDDIIQLEVSMRDLESIVATFIDEVLRREKCYRNYNI